MAQGDLTMFDDFAKQLGDGTHDLGSDIIKVALIDTTTDPTSTDAAPILGDYTQVTGTGYTSGGEEITTDTWAQNGSLWRLDGDNITWTQNGAGPTDIHWAIIYNDTATDDPCIAFIEMGNPGGTTPVSLQDGDITITWNTSGIFTVEA